MSSLSPTYILQQEVTETLQQNNHLLSVMGIRGGYNQLYSLNDKESVQRVLLYLYTITLQSWLNWTGITQLMSNSSVERILSKARQIFSSTRCADEPFILQADGISSSGVFGGAAQSTVILAPEFLKSIVVRGDQLISGSYIYQAGYDYLVYFNGTRYLDKGTEYTVSSLGVITILLTGPFTSEDKFIIIPNGTYS